jgi:DNA replication and repair protein RecF
MLTHLEATAFRNFETFQMEPGPAFNMVYGANGSGKSSLLEAIYLLGMGRSFRARLVSRVIRHEANKLMVVGQIADEHGNKIPVGIERPRHGAAKIRVNGSTVQSIAELAAILPVQLINQDSYHLIEGGPKYRRQFLDWGLFHVEQRFFKLWKRSQQILLQRNAELREGANPHQIKAWDNEFIITASELSALRENYAKQLLKVLSPILADLKGIPDWNITYLPGWDRFKELQEVLNASFTRDVQLGHTQYGPHRADLQICIDGIPAYEVLSRGEQKLFVYALRLAQGILLRELVGKKCIYLIDDLPAELDASRQQQVIQILQGLKSQVFVTGTALHQFQVSTERNGGAYWFKMEGDKILTDVK